MVPHRQDATLRNTLIAALVACADTPQRARIRRFVEGLSSDELQFIAGFLGACVLDSPGKGCAWRAQWAEQIARYQQESTDDRPLPSDRDHKLIVLREYLCRGEAPAAHSSGKAKGATAQ